MFEAFYGILADRTKTQMDRKLGGLLRRARVTDHISLGVIAAAIRRQRVREVLSGPSCASACCRPA